MKCPKCGSRMNRLYIQYKEGGKIFWKPLNGYYCRKCGTIIMVK